METKVKKEKIEWKKLDNASKIKKFICKTYYVTSGKWVAYGALMLPLRRCV